MIGLVVVTHSNLARELLTAAEMIVGPVEGVAAVGIHREDRMDEVQERIGRAIKEVDTAEDGVIIMTDMFGGTPANLSISFLEPRRIEVLTGVNLPMILKFVNNRGGVTPDEMAVQLKAYGHQSITVASEYLRK